MQPKEAPQPQVTKDQMIVARDRIPEETHPEWVHRNNDDLLKSLEEGKITRDEFLTRMTALILLGENRATTDSLTKLPNLRSFKDRVEAEQRILRHSGGKGFVGFLDLDDLKAANTRLGHEGGDELIITTAKAMQEAVDEAMAQANQSGNRINIFVGRKGGDEFLLFIGTTDRKIVTALTSRMISLIPERVKQNPRLPEDKLGRPQTLSMGMTTILPGSNIDVVIKKADDAVYKAKALGKNQVVFYEQMKPAERSPQAKP